MNDTDEEKQQIVDKNKNKNKDNNKNSNNNNNNSKMKLSFENINSMKELKEQEKILKLEIEEFLKEKEGFKLLKSEYEQEYQVKLMDYQEKNYSLKQRIELYNNALKEMNNIDPYYAQTVAKHLKHNKTNEKYEFVKKHYSNGKMLYDQCYNLLKIMRNETVKLNSLQTQYSQQSKELRSLIQMKSVQHRQFFEKMRKMRKEILYLPCM